MNWTLDFGISCYYNPDKNTDTFRLGSPGYAAPEQYKGRGQSSAQTDIFALGVLLFQLLTGYDPSFTPFKFPNMKTLNPLISDELEKIVLRAIELKPVKRYISIVEFKEQLEKYLKKHGGYIPTTSNIKRQTPVSAPSFSQSAYSPPAPTTFPQSLPAVNPVSTPATTGKSPLTNPNVTSYDIIVPGILGFFSSLFFASDGYFLVRFISAGLIWLAIWSIFRQLIVSGKTK